MGSEGAEKARLNAAKVHDTGAAFYERAAEFWDHHGYPRRAEAARRATEAQAAKAQLDRQPAGPRV